VRSERGAAKNAVSQPTGPSRTKALFASGLELHKQGRLSEAEGVYNLILAVDPDDADARHLLGVAFHQRGNHPKALEQIALSLRVNPNNSFALNNFGNAFQALGRLDDALASYEHAILVQPGNAEAHLNKANAFVRLGRFQMAVASYDTALTLRPDLAEGYCNRADALYKMGRCAEALASCDRALALRPDFPEALCNRGSILSKLTRFDDALFSYDRAIAVQPLHPEAHSNRGNVLLELKRYDEALASYERALDIRPDFAEAHCNQAGALLKLARPEEALASCDRALALRPNYAEAHSNRGNALLALKRLDEAVANHDRALAVRPDYAEAHSNRGNVLHQAKRFSEALDSYERAIEIRPDFADAHCNRGNVLQDLKRPEEALRSYDRALTIYPALAEAHHNRGAVLHHLGRYEEAVASCERALAFQPDYADAHCGRAASLCALNRYEEALASSDRALALQQDHAEAVCNRGAALSGLGRYAEALISYQNAVSVRSDFADAHYNEALCCLLMGDFDRGWAKQEWRWETPHLRAGKRNFQQPLWLGSDEIAGKTILLHPEQGLGDTLQFCRYAPLVAQRGARVVLEVQKPLHALMETLAGITQVISSGDPLPHFDVYCPLLSLPLAFGTEIETIPSAAPYLHAPEGRRRVWRERFDRHDRLRVGLVWAGDPRKHLPNANRIDRQRSISLEHLAPLLELHGCEFYSLQKGEAAVAQLHDNLHRERVVDWTGELHDFADTAALVEHLDLVISVDTSVAHLAGALGKPFWLLNRYNTCWRWLLDRDDSPWYPTVRLFRQDSSRQWDVVVTRLRTALEGAIDCFTGDTAAFGCNNRRLCIGATQWNSPKEFPDSMGKDRLTAFSDGVIAILITIMVLELRVPHGADWRTLASVAPSFLSYVMSFIYLAIYWNNHHHLLHTVTRVDGLILWANSHLLFWLSLVPAATAWMGENLAAPLPTAVYGVALLMPSIAYFLLQRAIMHRHGGQSVLAEALGRDLKGKLSPLLYAAAIALAFLSPWASIAIYVLVALMWLVPDRRIEDVMGKT
jgi:tetratricopeptide (TPR) repeat protein/uncharacterized membrane protein